MYPQKMYVFTHDTFLFLSSLFFLSPSAIITVASELKFAVTLARAQLEREKRRRK